MKKLILLPAIALMTASSAMALPKALYVKQDGAYTKYNFGVAGDLNFFDNGSKLKISGYQEAIDLDKIEYISFSAPVDEIAMSPAAQKQKMIEIGEAVYNKIDLKSHAEIIRMIDAFSRSVYDYNTDFYDPAPCEYDIPEEYWNVHKAAAKMVSAMGDVVKGNGAATRVIKAKAAELYRIEDYTGVYYANPKTKAWEKTGTADYLELRYAGRKGEMYTVRLTPSSDYTQWNTVDFMGRVPRQMDVTFNQDGTTLATATIKTEMVQDKSIAMTVTATVGKYKVENEMKVVNDKLTDVVNVTVNGEYFMTADLNVSGKNLVDYENIKEAIDEAKEYYNQVTDEWVDGDVTHLASMFYRATVNADVLGKLQARGVLFNFAKLNEVLSEDCDVDPVQYGGYDMWACRLVGHNSDYSKIDITDEKEEVYQSYVDFLNKYSDISFYYDGAKQLQGYLTFDVTEDNYSHDNWQSENFEYGFARIKDHVVRAEREYDRDNGKWGPWSSYGYNGTEYAAVPVEDEQIIIPQTITEVYYDVEPRMTFPDMTTFAFDEYFTEGAFKPLVNDYNDVLDTYYDLTGQERED